MYAIIIFTGSVAMLRKLEPKRKPVRYLHLWGEWEEDERENEGIEQYPDFKEMITGSGRNKRRRRRKKKKIEL